MSFITIPNGMGNILDDLKGAYEKLKPTIKVATQAYKDAKKGVSSEPQPVDAGVPAPMPQEPDPSSRGGFGVPNWMLYAGGAAILAIFFFRSKK